MIQKNDREYIHQTLNWDFSNGHNINLVNWNTNTSILYFKNSTVTIDFSRDISVNNLDAHEIFVHQAKYQGSPELISNILINPHKLLTYETAILETEKLAREFNLYDESKMNQWIKKNSEVSRIYLEPLLLREDDRFKHLENYDDLPQPLVSIELKPLSSSDDGKEKLWSLNLNFFWISESMFEVITK